MLFTSRQFRSPIVAGFVLLAFALTGCAQYATVKVGSGGPKTDDVKLEPGSEIRIDFFMGDQSPRLRIHSTDSDGVTTNDGFVPWSKISRVHVFELADGTPVGDQHSVGFWPLITAVGVLAIYGSRVSAPFF